MKELNFDDIFYWSNSLLIAIIAGNDVGTIYGKYLVKDYNLNTIEIAIPIGLIFYSFIFYLNYIYFKTRRR